MNMKRGTFVFIAVLLLSTFLINLITLVSAAPDTNTIVTGISNFFNPILTAIFGGTDNVLEHLLFALIIVAALYMALDNVTFLRNNAFALWAITIACAILAVRYIATEKLVNLLLLPQGAMGVALLTVIPLAVYFWFIEIGLQGPGNRILRKLGWAIYAAVWMIIWYQQIAGTAKVVVAGEWAYLYLIAAGLSVILMLVDGTIQNAIRKSWAIKHKETQKEILIDKILQKITVLQNQLAGATTPAAEKAIQSQIAILEKRIETVRKT